MADAEKKRPIRVAIVGSGMAGLVTAYLLSHDTQQRFAVTVFESGTTLSLDSASVSLPNASRTAVVRVDLPMRAFAGGYYNHLKAMYDHLGVQYHSQSFLFEFARANTNNGERKCIGSSSYFVHASNLHQILPPRPEGIGIIPYAEEVVYLLVCYAWFSFCCIFVAPRTGTSGVSETLEDYLKRIWLPRYFVTYYLLPLMSSVTTCPHKTLLSFPASDLADYKRRTNGAPHFTVSNGVQGVQKKLVRGISYKLSATVSAVEPSGAVVKIRWKENTKAEEEEEEFDRVVLAVPPDMVGLVFAPLQRAMSRIPTAIVKSVVHTDGKCLRSKLPPLEGTANTSSQLIYLRTATDSTHRTESIHVQPSGALVTTCPFTPIDPSLVIKSSKFTRVLRTPESQRIVNSIFGDTQQHCIAVSDEKAWRNGDSNVWLVGGWCWDGMVLLEGCVISAMRVADAFGVEIPWRKSS